MRKARSVFFGVLLAVLLCFSAFAAACTEPDAHPETGEEFTLSYAAETGGRIDGAAMQKVKKGESGSSVTAVAEEGYEFAGWSDGVTTAERRDENVTGNLTVTARFEKIPEFALSYASETGGRIEGETSQTVRRGGNGAAVTAVAEEGYKFAGWSDGVTTAERRDENVTENISVSARFAKNDTVLFAGGGVYGRKPVPYRKSRTSSEHGKVSRRALPSAKQYRLSEDK